MARAKRFEYVYAENEPIAVYQRSGSRFWQARITLTNGKSIAVSTQQTDPQKALQWAHDHKIRIEATDQDPTAKTFKKVAEAWLKAIEAEGSKSAAAYRTVAERYHIPFFGTYKITQINQQVLAEYERWRKDYWSKGPGSKLKTETIVRKDGKEYVRAKHLGSAEKAYGEDTTLRGIFKYAVDHDMLPASKMPVIGTKKAKSTKVIKARRYPAFNKEQVEKILAYCNAQPSSPKKIVRDGDAEMDLTRPNLDRQVFSAFVHLVLGTGLRPGREHVLIKWKHFREETVNGVEHQILRIAPETKTGERDVRCDTFAMAHLTAFRSLSNFSKDDDFVIADQLTGKPVKDFKRQFNTMCKALGMEGDAHGKKFVPYSMRHTYATLKLEAGVNIRLIANNIGNAPEVLHAHYGHDSTVNRANELATDLDYLGFQKPKARPKKRPPPPEPTA
ncbi:hypothetical protein A6A04_19850 [Paramagnetospirillum marisnigri]|uniref:Tyr recombinase domain-containing protein n=1 Tax=Paramagnetospirillum marisnigri TaxID=1285242 RepID=A0A178MJ56_9PROT|nr:tyrosine-type recombinase/integrase [Paramagnetospirillum marisnigri]OAN48762.1 hypothetical protein A6A04_19850 [Paramagnetospirillum marisnigri]